MNSLNKTSLTIFRDTSGTVWITKDKLEGLLVENIMDREYSNFTNALERLVALPYSYKVRDFVDKYRRPLMQQLATQTELPEVKYDENGRAYITTYGESCAPKIIQKIDSHD